MNRKIVEAVLLPCPTCGQDTPHNVWLQGDDRIGPEDWMNRTCLTCRTVRVYDFSGAASTRQPSEREDAR